MSVPNANSQSPSSKLSGLQLKTSTSSSSECGGSDQQQSKRRLSVVRPPLCSAEESTETPLEDQLTQRIEDWEDVIGEINDFLEEAADHVKPTDALYFKEYKFHSVPVKFPYDAYESQMQLMESLIKGVLGGHNCLLESPTGTGKTAALLCSLIGIRNWVMANRKKLPQEDSGSGNSCTCGLIPQSSSTEDANYVPKLRHSFIKVPGKNKKSSKLTGIICVDRQKSDCSDTTNRGEESQGSSPQKRGKLTIEYEDGNKQQECGSLCSQSVDTACQFCINLSGAPVKPPKTYYATRTHSQIAQVVKQLKNSPYKDSVNMAILSSRNQSCLYAKEAINKANQIEETELEDENIETDAKKSKEPVQPAPKVDNLDDACVKLKSNYFFNIRLHERIANGQYKGKVPPKEKPVCPYYKYGGEFKSIYDQIGQQTLDIEDLMEFGERNSCCAFFGSKYLHNQAEVVFVPYNYLLYPNLREAVEIEDKGSIVVFDEAHNIEDVCRDASSWEMDLIELSNHLQEVDNCIIEAKKKKSLAIGILDSLELLSVAFTSLKFWCKRESKKIETKLSSTLDGNLDPELGFNAEEIITVFTNAGLAPNRIVDNPSFNDKAFSVEKTRNEYSDEEEEKSDSPLSKKVKEFTQNLLLHLRQVYQSKEDFIMVMKSKGDRSKHNFSISFKCLNPALSFKSLACETLSIVVASGTLSPQTSFEGELQTKFSIKLSASHVVNPAHVLKLVLSTGIRNQTFELNKAGQQNSEVLDDIGHTILEICKIIPNGILVFLPSYKLLNLLKSRWNNQFTAEEPILHQMSKVKTIFFEESRDKEKFKSDMRNFKIIASQKYDQGSITGAILFAVYRGKVSEGIDFSDEQARAVIAVGIPYPPARSFEILSKQSFNNRKVPALLNGGEWYNVQAFRAMNQAFGRCIRHKDDWGAIILMDSRFASSSQSYVSYRAKNLSHWVQNGLEIFSSFQQVKGRMRSFFMKRRLGVTSDTTQLF